MSNPNNKLAMFSISTELMEEAIWMVAGFMRGIVVVNCQQHFPDHDPKKIIPAANLAAPPPPPKPDALVYVIWHHRLPELTDAQLMQRLPIVTCEVKKEADEGIIEYEWRDDKGKRLWGGHFPMPPRAVKSKEDPKNA